MDQIIDDLRFPQTLISLTVQTSGGWALAACSGLLFLTFQESCNHSLSLQSRKFGFLFEQPLTGMRWDGSKQQQQITTTAAELALALAFLRENQQSLRGTR